MQQYLTNTPSRVCTIIKGGAVYTKQAASSARESSQDLGRRNRCTKCEEVDEALDKPDVFSLHTIYLYFVVTIRLAQEGDEKSCCSYPWKNSG